MSLRERIKKYIESDPARFHMPGHKGALSDYDITELDFSDNISCPNAGIMEIQNLCAKEYGAKYANLLVNGSTAGILAFMLALTEKFDAPKILVGRDCHRSFVNACLLSGAEIVGVNPEDELCGVVTPNSIKNAFEYHKKIDAVFITSPNYYGMCANIEEISKIAHEYGAILFVDSAHGAHFPFSNYLPIPAIKHCDYCTVSTHKTLAALNQSAILLSNSEKLSQDSIQNATNMVQTTSPSYPIILSIEHGVGEAKNLWDKHCKRIQRFREQLLSCNIPLIEKPASAQDIDITRLCILAKPFANSGYEIEKKLNEVGIFPEMSDSYCVVLITTPYDSDTWYDRLLDALNAMKGNNTQPIEYKKLNFHNCLEFIRVRDSLSAPFVLIPIKESQNRLAKHSIGLYPPGISVVFPNERITKQKIDTISKAIAQGANPFGVEEGCIAVIKE